MRELERSFGRACAQDGFRLVHYSLQRDHAHLIVEARNAQALARGMKSVGSRLARGVNRVFGREGPVLADRYHLHVLRTPREVRSALRYVLLNVWKHTPPARRAGGVDPASSGRWFDGWKTPPAPARPARAAVAAARTWLLREGWRRHGLIDPEDVPRGHRR